MYGSRKIPRAVIPANLILLTSLRVLIFANDPM